MIRRFKRTTDSDQELQVFPNLYRNIVPRQPDQVWVGDLTYIRTVFGFAFLAALLDACSPKVVGCAISRRMDAKLTLVHFTRPIATVAQTREPASITRIVAANMPAADNDRPWTTMD